MTNQQVQDRIVAVKSELDPLFAKADADLTSDDVAKIGTLGEELKTLKSQADAFTKAQEIKSIADGIKTTTTPTNALPVNPDTKSTTPDIKFNGYRTQYVKGENQEDSAKGAYLLGNLFLAAAEMKGVSDVAASNLTKFGVEVKTHTEGNNALGGYLVPSELSNYIVNLQEQYGVARRLFRIEPMGSDTKEFIRMNHGVTASWGGEQTAFTTSTSTFDRISLTARKLWGYAATTLELEEDAIVSVGDYLANEFARQMEYKLDDACFNGDGTSTYGGITGVREKIKGLSGTIANIAGLVVGTGNAYSELTVTDFVKVKGKLPTYARNNRTAWLMHKDFHAQVVERLLMNSPGGLTATEVINGVPRDRFLGYPVVVSEVMPSTEANSQVCALLGDFSLGAVIGQRRGIGVARDTSLGFASDTVYYKATQRVDAVVHDVGNASATAASRVAGPIVGLITAAS